MVPSSQQESILRASHSFFESLGVPVMLLLETGANDLQEVLVLLGECLLFSYGFLVFVGWVIGWVIG